MKYMYLGTISNFCLVNLSLKCSGGPEEAHGGLRGQEEVGGGWGRKGTPCIFARLTIFVKGIFL